MRRISRLTLTGLLTASLPLSASAAISSAAIIASTSSPTCLEYKVVGICYWLLCTPVGCTVKTSTKVRHYIPDAVVSAYANTGENPWTEVSPMGAPNAAAQAGNDGTTNHNAENNIAKFKEADVIGHPGARGVQPVRQFLWLFLPRRDHALRSIHAQHAGHPCMAVRSTRVRLPGGPDSGHA